MYREWSSLIMIVGKFAGWLTYLPALPNCISISQNSTGGSSTTSFMLQDHTFPVAWFSMCGKCLLYSIWTILYPGLYHSITGKNMLDVLIPIGWVLLTQLLHGWFQVFMKTFQLSIALWMVRCGKYSFNT